MRGAAGDIDIIPESVLKRVGSNRLASGAHSAASLFVLRMTSPLYLGMRRLFTARLADAARQEAGADDDHTTADADASLFPFYDYLRFFAEAQLARLVELAWPVWVLAIVVLAVPAAARLPLLLALVELTQCGHL